MNIQPINPPLRPGQRVQCRICAQWTPDAVADLDKPVGTYYCPVCRDKLLAGTSS